MIFGIGIYIAATGAQLSNWSNLYSYIFIILVTYENDIETRSASCYKSNIFCNFSLTNCANWKLTLPDALNWKKRMFLINFLLLSLFVCSHCASKTLLVETAGEGEANDMNPGEKTMTENNEILDEGLDYIRDWRHQGPRQRAQKWVTMSPASATQMNDLDDDYMTTWWLTAKEQGWAGQPFSLQGVRPSLLQNFFFFYRSKYDNNLRWSFLGRVKRLRQRQDRRPSTTL